MAPDSTYNVMSILCLAGISGLGFASYAVPIEDFADRCSITLTLLLTAVGTCTIHVSTAGAKTTTAVKISVASADVKLTASGARHRKHAESPLEQEF